VGKVAGATARLMPHRDLVDFAARWKEEHRTDPGGSDDDPVIRPLQAADWEEWIRLRQALWPHHRRTDLETEAKEILASLARLPVFVAAAPGGGLLGMVEVSIRDRAEGCTTENIGYVEGWFVVPERRLRGIGRRLVEASETWAREHGCVEMAADTTSHYPRSSAAHAALGYQEVKRTVCFRKSLSAAASEAGLRVETQRPR